MNATPLWYWIAERHRIYRTRQAGKPWPWTQDKILQDFRFCNVFRELDAVTIWIREHIREPYAEHPNLWFMLCLARQIGHPATLQELIATGRAWPRTGAWSPGHAVAALDARKRRGEQVYTGAYMLRGDIAYGGSKHPYTIYTVCGSLWQHRSEFARLFDAPAAPSLRAVHRWFLRFHGWGGFMAYEVVTDLRHTRYLQHAPDTHTWANAGPGAIRGLNRLAGRSLTFPLKQDRANEEMRELLRESRTRLPRGFPTLEMRDIEHSLCETDKYLRVQNGEGRPRSRYRHD